MGIRDEFQTHKLNSAGFDKAIAISHNFNELVEKLEIVCPANREFAIARTKLEEACFFAKKAMARLAENQQPKEGV